MTKCEKTPRNNKEQGGIHSRLEQLLHNYKFGIPTISVLCAWCGCDTLVFRTPGFFPSCPQPFLFTFVTHFTLHILTFLFLFLCKKKKHTHTDLKTVTYTYPGELLRYSQVPSPASLLS
uniref:Uncharacterized protein n=1 Tax=Trypanosoma congolense (strain IL3000) TaxID=1068625 RepID=G0ULA8_TRYCI|nr:hypothetical protein, unlikely [Trypanosoma congolense IL3000]